MLIRKKLRPLGGTDAVAELLLPLPIGVFAAGVFDVTADVPTGFVVVHDRLILQELLPAVMVHELGDRVRLPVGWGVGA